MAGLAYPKELFCFGSALFWQDLHVRFLDVLQKPIIFGGNVDEVAFVMVNIDKGLDKWFPLCSSKWLWFWSDQVSLIFWYLSLVNA